ncbi:MAG: PepSY-associated TM helix domain-containing protein [Bacteroidota bacterium]
MEKEQGRRNYNIFFNTHTVTGITISIALYICFFCGAFALFMQNINNWEGNTKKEVGKPSTDFEKILDAIEQKGYQLEGRTFTIDYFQKKLPAITVRSQPLPEPDTHKAIENGNNQWETDSLARAQISLNLDASTFEILENQSLEQKRLGTFLYHLHYFGQVPIGILLSGLVSLFFLFAIVTGTLVHWKKVVSHFFTFRLKGSLKNLWTDAHTALGIIGLPFQFMYAITGAFYGLIILVFLPFGMVYFDGNFNKVTDYAAPSMKTYDRDGEVLEHQESINKLVANSLLELDNPQTDRIRIKLDNYKDTNAHLMVETWVDSPKLFFNGAIHTYRLSDGELVYKKKLGSSKYRESISSILTKLHFANFGGYFIKLIYFVLALITCFVILSGVMIWLEARNKKKYEHKKRFNTNVGAIYLGTSLGLFPSITLFFCMVKIFPLDMEGRYEMLSTLFFLFWLIFIGYAFLLKDFHKINKHALLLAGILGMLIPVFNGLQSGLWPWKSIFNGYVDSFFVDVSWFFLGIISFWIGLQVKRLIPGSRKGYSSNEGFASKVSAITIANGNSEDNS